MSPFVAEWFCLWRHFVNSSLTSSLFQNAVNLRFGHFSSFYINWVCINSPEVVMNDMQMLLSFDVFVFSFPGCGQTFVGDIGVITSPNHPDHHPVSLDCMYDIRVSNGSIVALTFSYFDLEPAESKSKITFFFCFFFLYYRCRAKNTFKALYILKQFFFFSWSSHDFILLTSREKFSLVLL